MKARIWEISVCIIPLLICATCLGRAFSAPAGHGQLPQNTKRDTALTLTIQMDNPQPSGAPVILRTVIANVGDRAAVEDFESFLYFKALLKGPDGKQRQVSVTNGAQIQGSGGYPPPLKPAERRGTNLRLTNTLLKYRGNRGYLPSEYVYVPAGQYQLKIIFEGRSHQPEGSYRFAVTDDVSLAEQRYNELQNPPTGREAFYKHVLEATLTPQIRKQWYAQITQSGSDIESLKLAGWRVYTLTTMRDLIPDEVDPLMVRAIERYVQGPDVKNQAIYGLLNNAAYSVLESRPPDAGPVLLKLATSGHNEHARTPAIQALRYYYEDSMREQLLGLLREQNRWVPIYTAWLLAWAGHDDGVDVLIAAASDTARNGSVLAAGALSYLENHPAASRALKDALQSSDSDFVQRLKQYLATIPAARNRSEE
jgi:hypothetical protein